MSGHGQEIVTALGSNVLCVCTLYISINSLSLGPLRETQPIYCLSRGLNIHTMQSGSSVGQLQVTRSGLISQRDSWYAGQIDVYVTYIFNAAGREENVTGYKCQKNISKKFVTST